ncbi:MAG: hypothetical protein ABIM30_01105 [candidate division WOR-3 bacterium]
MATLNVFSARGINTFSNDLAFAPEGSLKLAKNINIDRPGVIEPRRGFKVYSNFTTSTSRAKQLMTYKSNLIIQYDNKLAYDNNGVIVDYPGTFIPADSNIRTNFVLANGNLYLTSSDGIKKLSSATTASAAVLSTTGVPRGLSGEAIPDYSGVGFLPALSKVGYRITWLIRDASGNLLEGAPSPLFECANPSLQSCRVKLKFSPPPGITTNHFYRVYRTDILTSPSVSDLIKASLSDELKLVYEFSYDGSPIIQLDDITDKVIRDGNAPLYTNEFSGEGIVQSNYQPPFAKHIANFKGYTFFANTKVKHFKLLTTLGTDGFKTYGGNQVYDVDLNLDPLLTVSTITITNVVINTSNDLEITFSSLPPEISVGSYIFLYKPNETLPTFNYGSSSAYNQEYEVAAISGTTITITGPFSGTPTPNKTIVSTSYVSIQKGTNPEHRYFPTGVKELETFTFNSDLISDYPKTNVIAIYSADNKIKYGVWFAHLATDAPPPFSFDGAFVKVDLYSSPVPTTRQEIAQRFKEAIEDLTLDLEASEPYAVGPNYVVRVARLTSGTCVSSFATDGTTSGPVSTYFTGISAHNIEQKGVGALLNTKTMLLPRAFSPSVSIDYFTRSFVDAVNKNVLQGVNAFYVYNPGSTPGTFELVSSDFSEDSFIVDAYPASLQDDFNPELPTQSENLATANRIYFSKFRQPEHVPISNYFDIGSKEFGIEAIVPLRESLFIFKKDGVFRISGETASSFFISLLDSSAYLITSDAVTTLNNVIYAFTSQGVVQISEGGVGVISRGIEDQLSKYYSPEYINSRKHIFMFSSEEDRALFLAAPDVPTDNYATRIFRYNVFTTSWTDWRLKVTCATTLNNKIFFGSGDISAIEVERKDFKNTDYADRIYSKQFTTNFLLSPTKIKFSSVSNLDGGDQLYQKQAVSVSKFNLLLNQLLNDPLIIALTPVQKAFYQSLTAVPGDNISNKLNLLATQLNADLSESFPTTFSLDQDVLFTQFNNFVTALNTSSALFFANYPLLTTYSFIYSPIKSVNSLLNEVEIFYSAPFIVGDLEVHKGIETEFEYNPITFGDPSLLKHVRYGSVMLANADLIDAKLGVASDLSNNFEFVRFQLEGDGSWGDFFWSNNVWGGVGSQRPFRTIIPLKKQRCRFIKAKFKHNVAFYKYLFFGISFEFEVFGTRAYR